MLILNDCGFSNIPHEKMKEEIAALISRGCRSYLIVPEQQTVTAESEMARELPECAPLFFEVTNFTRLCDSVFRSVGGVCRKHADSAASSLIMWRTLTELSPHIDMTRGHSDIGDGLVKKALSAIGELNAGAIESEELRELSESDAIGKRLKCKLSDIALVSSLYKKLLEEKYSDSRDAHIKCARALAENPELFSNTVFFIDGFTSFTEPQYKIISELMKRCELRLYLPLPRYEYEGFEYLEIRRTKSRIISIADKYAVQKKVFRDVGFDNSRPALLNDVIRLLWRSDGEIDNESLQNIDSLRVFETHTPFDECDFVCSDIKRRVMAGESYSDFAIIIRAPEEYRGVLDVSLEKAGLPYFMSHTHDATEYEAVKFIFSAYCAMDGFRREDVISYMKCGFCDVSRDEADEFERTAAHGRRLMEYEPRRLYPSKKRGRGRRACTHK